MENDAMATLTDNMFTRVAERFKALGEPARLRILDALRRGELTVGDLRERTRINQANLSKHLQVLHSLGFVERRKDGLFVYYRLGGDEAFQLCDIMCGRIEQLQRQTALTRVTRARRPMRRLTSRRQRANT
jgi:DNA-binding transcriptional ArsR family regulator